MRIAELNNILETLKTIGLTENEANIYCTLLNYNQCTVSILARHTGLNRTTCYSLLSKLEKQGYIQKIVRNEITYFLPGDLKILINKLIDHQKSLEENIQKVTLAAESIENLRNRHIKSNRALFFEGAVGIKNIMEDTLTAREPIRAYANLLELQRILPDYFQNYSRRRTAKKLFVRALYTADIHSYRHKLKDKDELRESRLIPKEFDFNLDFIVYDNKVVIISLKAEFGVLIESQEMADQQKKFFDTIWEIAKSYDQKITDLFAETYKNSTRQKSAV